MKGGGETDQNDSSPLQMRYIVAGDESRKGDLKWEETTKTKNPRAGTVGALA